MKYKKYYDEKVRQTVLEPGDRVLVRNVGLKGCHKIADRWQRHPYIVVSQLVPDIPIYRVKKEHSNPPAKLLHRNMLLPFIGLPSPDDDEETAAKKTRPQNNRAEAANDVTDDSYPSSSSDDLSDDEPEREPHVVLRPPRYPLPDRNTRSRTNIPRTSTTDSRIQQRGLRRGTRARRPPQWIQNGD